jgi:hypothetical protein
MMNQMVRVPEAAMQMEVAGFTEDVMGEAFDQVGQQADEELARNEFAADIDRTARSPVVRRPQQGRRPAG